MVEMVFSEEQREMLANCVLAQIKNWRKVSEGVCDGELSDLSQKKIGELMTLLNYISA